MYLRKFLLLSFANTIVSGNHMANLNITIGFLINYISSLFDISDNDIRLLTHCFKNATFQKGSILEKENTVAKKLYFIKNGFIRTFFNEDGIEITTQIVAENNFITGFNSFVSGVISNENIQCISDCEVIYITKSDYETLTKESAIWSVFCKHVL